MRRTQLYLEEDMARALAAESRRRGTTVSLLVRDAVAKVYGRGEAGDRRAIIDRLAGVWADRNDLGEDFFRALRRSSRSRRRGRGQRGKVPARQRHRH